MMKMGHKPITSHDNGGGISRVPQHHSFCPGGRTSAWVAGSRTCSGKRTAARQGEAIKRGAKEGSLQGVLQGAKEHRRVLGGLQFELKVGEYDWCGHLHGLLDLKPTGEDLNRLENESGGLRAFLRLRAVPKWSADEKLENQARKDAEELLFTLGRYHTDPARIDTFSHYLGGDADAHTPEERAYAIRELKKAGAAAVPPLIDALRPTTGEERRRMVDVLTRFGQDAAPPMLGALDIPDNPLRADLIRVMLERAEAGVVPFVVLLPRRRVYLSQRAEATTALSRFLQTPADKLPPAKVAQREAEQY